MWIVTDINEMTCLDKYDGISYNMQYRYLYVFRTRGNEEYDFMIIARDIDKTRAENLIFMIADAMVKQQNVFIIKPKGGVA